MCWINFAGTRLGQSASRMQRYLLHSAIMVELFIIMTDHLLVPFATTTKQLGLLPCQEVQKPSGESFHVPSPLEPALATGARVALPSGMNSILNFTPDGVAAVNGWPLKNVAWISFGISLVAAIAAPLKVSSALPATVKIRANIGPPNG